MKPDFSILAAVLVANVVVVVVANVVVVGNVVVVVEVSEKND